MNKTIQDIIIGTLHGDEKAQAEIRDWCLVACALERLHNARIGLMGHVLESMYDMHTDPTALYAAFGVWSLMSLMEIYSTPIIFFFIILIYYYGREEEGSETQNEEREIIVNP
jgi:hypothetical protein